MRADDVADLWTCAFFLEFWRRMTRHCKCSRHPGHRAQRVVQCRVNYREDASVQNAEIPEEPLCDEFAQRNCSLNLHNANASEGLELRGGEGRCPFLMHSN